MTPPGEESPGAVPAARLRARRPRLVFAPLILLSLWAIGYELACAAFPSFTKHPPFNSTCPDVAFAIAGLLLIARGRRGERAWALIGIGSLCWAAGDIYWSIKLSAMSSPPVPSPADAGYLLFCPLAFAGILALVRSRVNAPPRMLIADAVAAALAAAAVSAAIVVQPIMNTAQGGWLAVATNLAYPINDLFLLALIVGAIALSDWKVNRTWLLLGASVIAFWIADSLYLKTVADNTYQLSSWFNPLWYWSPILAAWAAWLPSRRMVRINASQTSARGITMVVSFAALAVALLAFSSAINEGPLAVGLATCSLLVIIGRLVATWRENLRLLAASQQEAITDALTGLRNRRALIGDLTRRLEAPASAGSALLALFDLDGFKLYNDSFGHPAGDSLLQRLGSSLGAHLAERGTVYRMGGDEFCALIELGASAYEADELSVDPLVAEAAEALSDQGEGFSVSASYGAVVIPREADSAEEALRIADQRMYALKHGGRRASASRQSGAVLLMALAERDPDLGSHLRDVGDLAAATAENMGLAPEEAERIREAAELHDVGKVAIPDAILRKPGTLDEQEWAFIRRHTLIGERILTAAPALGRLGPLVRSSHERWDGTGYPDGLRGSAIPLGARIISACDAFHAMTADRPYRLAISEEAAVVELRRCSGTQFDPAVVDAFCSALALHRWTLASAA